jgi:importin subunit alpha-6/7
MDTGVSQRLVELLRSSGEVQQLALEVIGNFLGGTEKQTQAVLQLGVLPVLIEMLSATHATVVSTRTRTDSTSGSAEAMLKSVIRAVSNIAAGTEEQVQALIDAGAVPKVVALLNGTKTSTEIKKEAAWVLVNIASEATASQIELMLSHDPLQALCPLLANADTKVSIVAVEGLDNILKASKKARVKVFDDVVVKARSLGLPPLRELAKSENEDLKKKAQSIIDTYFS